MQKNSVIIDHYEGSITTRGLPVFQAPPKTRSWCDFTKVIATQRRRSKSRNGAANAGSPPRPGTIASTRSIQHVYQLSGEDLQTRPRFVPRAIATTTRART